MEFLLFGSMVWFWIVAFIVFVATCISEKSENGWGAFWSIIIFLILVYFWGEIEIFTLTNLKFVLAYLGIGFVYALIRAYFYGVKSKRDDKVNWNREKLKDKVFLWWFLMPFSLFNWILSDLISDFYNLLYAGFGKLFSHVFSFGAGGEEQTE